MPALMGWAVLMGLSSFSEDQAVQFVSQYLQHVSIKKKKNEVIFSMPDSDLRDHLSEGHPQKLGVGQCSVLTSLPTWGDQVPLLGSALWGDLPSF